MKLPDNSIGISDILAHDECARRFAYGMRRHTEPNLPEADGPANAYGSAFHEGVAFIRTEGASDDEAIDHVMQGKYGRWIAPDDLVRLKDDFVTYRSRDLMLGVRTIMSERDVKVPLFMYEGEQIYYRFKVDRLYQSASQPGTFISVDYKTSLHPKSESEIHNDAQQSAYAFGLHEFFPEIENLIQLYDQLNFGVVTTSRTKEQIDLIREWLIAKATAILRDDELSPTLNQWCGFCPLLMDCSVIGDLTNYATGVIAGMIPAGTEIRGANAERLSQNELGTYVEQLDVVSRARKVLEKFEERVRGDVSQLPIDKRLALGFKTNYPKVSSWSPEALETLAEVLGPDLFRLVKLTKTAVARLPKTQQDMANALATQHRGAARMTRVRQPVESPFGDPQTPDEDS